MIENRLPAREMTNVRPSGIFVYREVFSNYFYVVEDYEDVDLYETQQNFVFYQFIPLN